jgi:hypothetical protein
MTTATATATKKVLYTSHKLDTHLEDFSIRVGMQAAMLHHAGFSCEYVKIYVKWELMGLGINREEILESEALARGGYLKASSQLKGVNPEMIAYGIEDNGKLKFCWREGLDKVNGAKWLVRRLNGEVCSDFLA